MCIELRFQLYTHIKDTDRPFVIPWYKRRLVLCSPSCGHWAEPGTALQWGLWWSRGYEPSGLPLYSKWDSRVTIMIPKALVHYAVYSLLKHSLLWFSWPIARIKCDILRYKVRLIWCLTWLCTPSRLFPVTSSYTSPTTLYTIAVGINVTQFIKQRTCPQPWQCMNIRLQSACREHSQSEHVTWEQMKDDNVWSNDVKKGGVFLNKSGTLKWRNTEQKIRVVEIYFQIK